MLLLVVVDCEVASGDWHDLKVVVWCMGAVGCPVVSVCCCGVSVVCLQSAVCRAAAYVCCGAANKIFRMPA